MPHLYVRFWKGLTFALKIKGKDKSDSAFSLNKVFYDSYSHELSSRTFCLLVGETISLGSTCRDTNGHSVYGLKWLVMSKTFESRVTPRF